MKYGLTKTAIEKICAVFARIPEIEKAVLYGSRAKGNFKPGSDIDLTLFGENLNPSQLGEIAEALDDLLLPYTIDLSLYAELNHAKLREHIDRVGVVFYQRGSAGGHHGAAMKKGWQTKTLEEVCQFSNGLWKGEKPPFVNVGVIRNTNFTKEGMLDDSDIAYLDVEVKKFEKRRLQFGDIILEKSGGGPKQPVGRVVLFDKQEGDFSFSNFTAALRILEPHELDFRFLHKFLHWTYLSGVTEEMQSHSTGIRNLDGDAYKAINITFPPLHDQQRIVGLLDEAFEDIATAKANAEKNLQNARALFESHLQSVFTQRGPGWVTKPLADCLELITYGFTNPMPTTAEGPYMITAKNVVGGRIEYASTRRTSREAFDTMLTDKSRPRVGDVLLTKDGTLGRVAVVDQPDTCINQSVALLRPNGRMNPQFMRCLLSSSDYQQRMVDDAGGATIKHIYITRVDKMPVTFPESLAEQQKVAAGLDSLSAATQRLARLYERKLAALEALKKSLLHQAVSGEL